MSNYEFITAWPIGSFSKEYGTVVAMGVTGGEQYRWFIDECGAVSMIPLFMLLLAAEGE